MEGSILTDTAKTHKRKNGTLTEWSVKSGSREVPNAAFSYTEPTESAPDLRGHIALDFNKMDQWFEEDEELIGHPRDPFTRIDVRKSSLKVRVEARGIVLAESHNPLILTETGLPLRYYIPRDDVNWTVLTPTETDTVCPYKGHARYWSAEIEDAVFTDIAWAYQNPLQDAWAVKDTVCFYQEKLDVYIDDQLEEKPPVHFSK
jgi:uncharacterized protein (DUF427 family)